MSKIILASQSPRRREILEQIGLKFECIPSDKEEVCNSTKPDEMVMELALQKAEDVALKVKEYDLIIGSDTVVACDDVVLGKPKDKQDAINMIKKLQGRKHQVYTGVALVIKGEKYTFYRKTDVYIYKMTDNEIEKYVESGEPMDKAGAYGIQGRFAAYVEKIEGDYYNVVGLPVSAIVEKIKSVGREDLLSI